MGAFILKVKTGKGVDADRFVAVNTAEQVHRVHGRVKVFFCQLKASLLINGKLIFCYHYREAYVNWYFNTINKQWRPEAALVVAKLICSNNTGFRVHYSICVKPFSFLFYVAVSNAIN